jgi:integrase
MAAVRLTESAIKRAAREAVEAGARAELSDEGCTGLRLRLTPTGGASWVLACRDREGRMRRFPLGTFPDLGVSSAREAARTLRPKVKVEGADPVADRRRDRAMGKAAKAGVGTLAALLALYGEHHGAELKSWGEGKRRIESVFKRLLNRPLGMLTATDFQMEADIHPAKQSSASAVRCVRPVLKWAAQRRYVAPAVAALVPPATVKRRKRWLSRDEMAALLPVLSLSRRPHGNAMRFMLLTLTRREETGQARWGDIDLTAKTWTLRQTKNDEPHVVPLSRQALALLKGIKPAKAKAADLIFHTSTGAALGNWDRETKAIQRESGTAGWTRHDLRRTGATMLGEMGELPDIIEAALNHVAIRSTLAATYNRSRYRPQVAVALQRLGDALDGIEAGAAEVRPLRPQRA